MLYVPAQEQAEEIEAAFADYKMAEERYYSHIRRVDGGEEKYIRDCKRTEGIGKRYARLWDEWTYAKFRMGELTGCSDW